MQRSAGALALLLTGLVTGSTGAAMLWGGVPSAIPVGTIPVALPALLQPGTPHRVSAPNAFRRSRTGAPPVRLVMARLGATAPVVPESVGPDGALGVPEDPGVLGWWSGGAAPGAGSGSVVVDGHVDSARFGVGVLAGLRRLKVGDDVEMASATGAVVRYAVAARRSYPKAALPNAVFSQQGPERLVLITCGGHFDPSSAHYSDNVVVWAEPRLAG